MPWRRWSLLLCGPCLSWEGPMPKVGDIIRVNFVISHINKDGSVAVIRPRYSREKDVLSWATQHIASFYDNEPGVEIVKSPWVPAVGDIVVSSCAVWITTAYTIFAIVGDRVWLQWQYDGKPYDMVGFIRHFKLKETTSS